MDESSAVVRIWRGAIRTGDRDAYARYIEETGLAEYRDTDGNLDATMLMRDRGDGTTEVLTVSRWRDRAAIVGFAGDDIERAVFYPEDDRFLVERDEFVNHFDVVG
ncbi:hypothetical protein [Agromyces sp. LHK192]|uniref:hypothetical protein n=1 Tax=Agromyces sp. LHK192 TaxID=2498704 RepID=UPI000FD8A7C8|nr:hypothetical protein [Agromyces sp. LHK192]